MVIEYDIYGFTWGQYGFEYTHHSTVTETIAVAAGRGH